MSHPLGEWIDSIAQHVQEWAYWIQATLTGEPSGGVEGGGLAGIMLLFLIMVFVAAVLYYGALEFLARNRRSIPFLARSPLGYPKPGDYLADTSGALRPEEFYYEWPDVVVAGTRYNLSRATRDPKNKLKFHLDTGTVVEFVPKK